MGKTKRAKKVKISYKGTIKRVAHYNCPSCKTHYEDHSMSGTVLRLECSHCGQELIVIHD